MLGRDAPAGRLYADMASCAGVRVVRRRPRRAPASRRAPQSVRTAAADLRCTRPSRPDPLATIDITRPHTLGPAGARKAADAVAARLRAEYGVRSEWKGDALHVTGRGIDGRLDAGPETVRVTAKLGLLARPFAGPLRREIERELDRVAPLS